MIVPSAQFQNKTVVPEAPTETELVQPIARKIVESLQSEDRFDTIYIDVPNLGDDIANLKEQVSVCNAISDAYPESYILNIHSDGGYKGSGASAFYVSNNGRNWISPIFSEMGALTPWSDMQLSKRDNLMILNKTKAVAGLLEISFHDKKEEAYWIFNNVNNIAGAIVNGIYQGLQLPRYFVPDWQWDAFKSLVNKGVLNNPTYWSHQLHKNITIGEVFGVINKITGGKSI